MTILAIETSTQCCSVALFFSQEKYFYRHEKVGNLASQNILPWIQELMVSHHQNWDDISSLAVSQGPGAFTGIRLGVGIAQGLAFAKNKPLIPVPSLDGMVAYHYLIEPSRLQSYAKIQCLVDARMDETYTASYVIDQKGIKRIGLIHLEPSLDFSLQMDTIYLAYDLTAPKGANSGESLNFVSTSPHALGIAFSASLIEGSQLFLARDCQPLYIRDQIALTTEQRAAKLL
jgi:tRNA threonylcarbamoyladenosine biosynthesis protein TsaB